MPSGAGGTAEGRRRWLVDVQALVKGDNDTARELALAIDEVIHAGEGFLDTRTLGTGIQLQRGPFTITRMST